jgi:hypothetical protein
LVFLFLNLKYFVINVYKISTIYHPAKARGILAKIDKKFLLNKKSLINILLGIFLLPFIGNFDIISNNYNTRGLYGKK